MGTKTINILKDPFPTEILTQIDVGAADGRRDSQLESAFIKTNAVKKFIKNRQSIIIGPIGSGKSALFKLLKNKSKLLDEYSDYEIVAIDEAISFVMLGELLTNYFHNDDKRLIYQLLWKFQIAVRISEELSKQDSFPKGQEEKEINSFLLAINSKDKKETIVERLVRFLKENKARVSTSVADVPINVEFAVISKSEINPILDIDRILKLVSDVARKRCIGRILVIIDKIDSFVAGQEYEIQRSYIEALLEVEDDLSLTTDIQLKIFLREDLFSRLSFERLGYDKVNDNALRLTWTKSELLSFIAHRILESLKDHDLLTIGDVFLSTDLEEYHLFGLQMIRILPWLPLTLKRKIFDYQSINKEREISLHEKLDKAVVSKILPREITYKNRGGKEVDINMHDFICSYFRDGNNRTTPRNLLIFLNHLYAQAADYYDNNPDQSADVIEAESGYEWKLIKKRSVISAYHSAKEEYLRNISKVDDRWSGYFATFLRKKGSKKTFNANWVKSILSIEDEEVSAFMGYLDHIGFLRTEEAHPDINKRQFSLPVIYN